MLLTDTRENNSSSRSSSKRIQRTLLQRLLQRNRDPQQQRCLPVGDFAWVWAPDAQGAAAAAAAAAGPLPQKLEFMLPILVERKTPADLMASILDGGSATEAKGPLLLDQQQRLMEALGIETVIFLCEGDSSSNSSSSNTAAAAVAAAPQGSPTDAAVQTTAAAADSPVAAPAAAAVAAILVVAFVGSGDAATKSAGPAGDLLLAA
ncbi:hypothetical protein Efla_002588 [Eimeria flavescens]